MSETKTSRTEQQQLVEAHDDFILLRRFGYSLQKALEKHPDGLPDHLVAQALGKSVPWVQRRYTAVVAKLRELVDDSAASST